MTTRAIERSCICELMALVDGWRQRRYDLEDLLLACCTLPVYQMGMGKKAPTMKELTRHRPKENPYAGMSYEELLDFASE